MLAYRLLKEQFCVVENDICQLENTAIYVSDHVTEDDTVITVTRTVENRGKEAVSFLPCISIETENAVKEWFVPSVSYSGNVFGDGMEPKGLTHNGKPWIFSSDHGGVPGCTVVMGENGCSALFLAPEQVSSACSLEISDKTVIQRAFFTYIEYPQAYLEKYRYGNALINEMTLSAGEYKTFISYFFLNEENNTFSYRSFISYLLNRYAREPMRRDTPEIYEYSMSFLRRLIEKTHGLTLTNMGFLPRPDKRDPAIPGSEFVFRASGRYECGWCGQNISNAWLLLFDHAKTNGISVESNSPIASFDISFAVKGKFDVLSDDYRNAIAILDSWQSFRFESGLIPVLLDDVFKGKKSLTLDLCNLGWLVYQYLNCYVLLRNGGIDRGDYLETARGVLDAVLHYPALGKGFPQTVNEHGEVLCERGMAGAMMTVAALQMYRVTGEEKYLTAGKDSFQYYYEHYLSHNVAAGAALDTYCVDKESAGPVLRSALMLERLTGDRAYLEKAENIACYLQTWMFYYDIPFPPESDAGKSGFTTLGATAVSAQHHHLDCWASYYIPDFRYLSEKTDDPLWKRASDYLREYTFQGISDGKTALHGFLRPAGAQNEAIFQCNWSFDGKNEKGQFNDWLVSWVNSFRLMDMVHEEITKKASR